MPVVRSLNGKVWQACHTVVFNACVQVLFAFAWGRVLLPCSYCGGFMSQASLFCPKGSKMKALIKCVRTLQACAATGCCLVMRCYVWVSVSHNRDCWRVFADALKWFPEGSWFGFNSLTSSMIVERSKEGVISLRILFRCPVMPSSWPVFLVWTGYRGVRLWERVCVSLRP